MKMRDNSQDSTIITSLNDFVPFCVIVVINKLFQYFSFFIAKDL